MMDSHSDGTLDCDCGLPLFPVALTAHGVRYECANRDVRIMPLPKEARLRRLVQNWIDRRTGQLDEQHRRRDENDR